MVDGLIGPYDRGYVRVRDTRELLSILDLAGSCVYAGWWRAAYAGPHRSMSWHGPCPDKQCHRDRGASWTGHSRLSRCTRGARLRSSARVTQLWLRSVPGQQD